LLWANTTDGTGRTVARTANHQAISGEPQLAGDTAGEPAGHLARFEYGCQEARFELELVEQFVRPTAIFDVQQQHPAGVAHLGGKFASQPPANVVLGEQHFGQPLEVLRFVVAEPQNLGGGETGEGRIGDHFNEFGAATGAVVNFVALGGGALVVPQNGGANHLVVFVQKHRPVHLARQPNRPHVGRLATGGGHRTADGRFNGLPPIFGILLAPQRPGMCAAIAGGALAQQLAGAIDGNGLGARGADIDAEINRRSHGAAFDSRNFAKGCYEFARPSPAVQVSRLGCRERSKKAANPR
jgi:hypothetical protein